MTCRHDVEAPEEITLSSFEQIAYWGCVIAATALTVAALLGFAGYAMVKTGVLA